MDITRNLPRHDRAAFEGTRVIPFHIKLLILAAVLAPFSVWYELPREQFQQNYFEGMEVGCREVTSRPLSVPVDGKDVALISCHWRFADGTWMNSRHF